MKFRSDFVTNSSSSSFICSACGNVEAGYDMSLSDANMVECENGHTICEYHVSDSISFKNKKEVALRYINDYIGRLKTDNGYSEEYVLKRMVSLTDKKDFIEKLTEEDYEDNDDLCDKFDDLLQEFDLEDTLPEELCPLCTHSIVTETESLNYALGKLNMTKEQLEEMTRQYLIEKDKEEKTKTDSNV